MKEVKYEILSTMNTIGIENGVLVMGRAFGASQDTGLHWRDGLEITLLLEGESEYYCEGRRGRYHVGELCLANSGVVFSERNARPDEYIAALAMVLPDSFITFYAPNVSKPYFRLEKDTVEWNRIKSRMANIAGLMEREPQPPYVNLLIHREILSILSVLFESCYEPEHQFGKEYGVIRECVTFVSEHYPEDIPLKRIAAAIGLQENYFRRVFKRQFGMSFHQYLGRVCLDAALALIAARDESALGVAVQVGFSSDKLLINWCKKIYHCTPLQYKKRMKKRNGQGKWQSVCAGYMDAGQQEKL